jgi:hypothetical protein
LNSAKDPLDVAVDDSDGLVAGDAGDGGRGVGAYAGELAETMCGSGHSAAMVGEDGLSGCVEHAGTAVVAEAAPEGKNVLLVGFGEGLNRRKALEEGGIALDDYGDAGLLEHDFGDPDGVWIGGLAPGEIALAAVIPDEEFGSHAGDGLLGGPAAAGHGERLRHPPAYAGPVGFRPLASLLADS